MKTRHTPGPWVFRENWGKAKDEPEKMRKLCFHSIETPKGTFLASTWGEPHLPNARLIAAAPELLDALKSASNQLTSDGHCPTLVAIIDAVIAEATGGQ